MLGVNVFCLSQLVHNCGLMPYEHLVQEHSLAQNTNAGYSNVVVFFSFLIFLLQIQKNVSKDSALKFGVLLQPTTLYQYHRAQKHYDA